MYGSNLEGHLAILLHSDRFVVDRGDTSLPVPSVQSHCRNDLVKLLQVPVEQATLFDVTGLNERIRGGTSIHSHGRILKPSLAVSVSG